MSALEQDNDGAIQSFGDGLWWVITTVTTVGYGDAIPVTAADRGVSAFLMVTGIALFGILTANIAAFFIETGQESDPVIVKLNEVLDTPWPGHFQEWA